MIGIGVSVVLWSRACTRWADETRCAMSLAMV